MTSSSRTSAWVLGMAMTAALAACSDTRSDVDRNRTDQIDDATDRAGDRINDAGRDAADGARDAAREGANAVGTAGRAVGAALETADVKTALMTDRRVDAGDINVDTDHNTKTVTLKGTVPTAAQKDIAGEIAKTEAKGYRVENQLTVGRR